MFSHSSANNRAAHFSARWRSVWVVAKTAVAWLRFFAILVCIGAVILYWPRLEAMYEKWTRPLLGADTAVRSDIEYWCPMHPTVVQDKPGKCPVCGMPLSRRKKSETEELEPLAPGIVSRVQLTPYREAVAGIRTTTIGYRALNKEIRTVGFVEFDEQKLARINNWLKGKSRIDKLYANVTGGTVEKGEPLAELYSPELVVTITNLLDAHRASDSDLERSARERLRLWGIDSKQIDAILQSGRPTTHITIRSPIRGHVIRKYQEEGDYVEEGARLYDIADLHTVWIEAQVYEDEISLLQDGMPVRAVTRALPNREFTGHIGLIHPHLDTSTRTLRVRFDIANPHHELRPGMWATVTLDVPATRLAPLPGGADKPGQEAHARGEVLAVPEQAVIDTGTRKLVYRQAEPDIFEGVEVHLGPRCGDYYPVLHGLTAGDLVATAGSFLIDAETRLATGPGSTYYGATGGPQSQRENTVAMRPSTTRDEDEKVRANLAHLSPADRTLAEAQGHCPVLGTRLGLMGPPIEVVLNGQRVFLCCKNCVLRATTAPTDTLARLAKLPTKSGVTVTPAKSAPAPATAKAAKIQKNLARLVPADRPQAEAQTVCPVTGQALGSMGVPVKIAVGGHTFFLCCENCRDEAKQHPEDTLARLKQILHGGQYHD